MQIYISMLRGSKVMESKAPNLEGLLQTPVRCFISILYLSWPDRERCKDEDKALLGNEESYSSAHECVD